MGQCPTDLCSPFSNPAQHMSPEIPNLIVSFFLGDSGYDQDSEIRNQAWSKASKASKASPNWFLLFYPVKVDLVRG